MKTRYLISVVDDDESVRQSLPDLLEELGYAVCAFASGEAFLSSEFLDTTCCLILDVAMPGMSGPDLQRELQHRSRAIPIIFITALREETVAIRLIELGAVACLTKPFSEVALLRAINAALQTN
jgi:FixJ family two-component response regulator